MCKLVNDEQEVERCMLSTGGVFISHLAYYYFAFSCIYLYKMGNWNVEHQEVNIQTELPPVVEENAALTYR